MDFPTNFRYENLRRNERFSTPYDPLTGNGCLEPRQVYVSKFSGGGTVRIPESMNQDPEFYKLGSLEQFERLRCRHDFEYWAAKCVKIRDKRTGNIVPFVLNFPQRKVLAVLEADRLAGRPIRMILLKARQWGGSTLVQMYMAWIQTTQRTNWHSIICSHLKDSSRSILGMYEAMTASYPMELWLGDANPGFRSFERSQNIRVLSGRDCRVTLASAESQEGIRGADIAMAHLSETAFWPETDSKSPADYMRTVCGTVPLEPMTLIVIESTANGTGNFFHDEWQRNLAGKGDKHAVFIPWYDIPIYSQPVASEDEARSLWPQLTPYEQQLWYERGCSMEQIKWYHNKALEYASADKMHAEFPGTAEEAFVNSGANVFDSRHIKRLREACREPLAEIPFTLPEALRGAAKQLSIWALPEEGKGYIATVDVGGRTERSDFSVIAVMTYDEAPEVVAQWRGHVDHDLLARYAMALGEIYNDALLVVESNTLESENMEQSSEGVLGRLYRCYPELYCRSAGGDGEASLSPAARPGLHTNRATKAAMIDYLIGAVRTPGGIVERDNEACNELAAYMCHPNGSYSARRGKHDDILMTRAMALYVIHRTPDYAPFDAADYLATLR